MLNPNLHLRLLRLSMARDAEAPLVLQLPKVTTCCPDVVNASPHQRAETHAVASGLEIALRSTVEVAQAGRGASLRQLDLQFAAVTHHSALIPDNVHHLLMVSPTGARRPHEAVGTVAGEVEAGVAGSLAEQNKFSLLV